MNGNFGEERVKTGGSVKGTTSKLHQKELT